MVDLTESRYNIYFILVVNDEGISAYKGTPMALEFLGLPKKISCCQ